MRAQMRSFGGLAPAAMTDAKGIVVATQEDNKPAPVSLGSGHEISIRDLSDMTARLIGFTGTMRWDASKPNCQPRRCLDVQRVEFGIRATTWRRRGELS